MAHRIEPRLRSPKNEQPSQPAQKLHIEVPATPSVRKDLNTSPSPKIITFAFSLAVVGFLIYQKPSFDETVLAWAQKMLSETNTILKTLTNDAQAALSGPSRKALAINTPTGSRTSQAEWISEAKNTFFQLSASDRVRIQSWLANGYGYNGARDGLWGPRTEASFLLARNAHTDVDRLFVTAFLETPAITDVSRLPTQSGSTANAQKDLQNRIIQLRAACIISPRGSIGERLADQQLYILAGERCARPPPAFQPILPIQPILPMQPNAPTRCTQRLPPGNFRIPGMTYPLEFECR